MAGNMGAVIEHLGEALNGIGEEIELKIDNLASRIDEMTGASSTADVGSIGVSEGDILKDQFALAEMQKGAESATDLTVKSMRDTKKLAEMARQM